jgi:transcriptional regulator with XRE-family HTH domain
MTKKDIFADRLRLARELRELNQGALADKAGIPASSISHFEANARKPSFDTLRRLASALEVSTDYLLGRVDDVSASSAEGDQAFRDFHNLSASDREAIKLMMESLAKRGEANKKIK